MRKLAEPPFGTRIVMELDKTWSVVVEGSIVGTGYSMEDAILVEAIEIAALSPCTCGSTAGDTYQCPDCRK
jgi:hypothetical protein